MTWRSFFISKAASALFEAIRTMYDQTCDIGGFLSDGMEHVDNLRDRYSIAPVIVP